MKYVIVDSGDNVVGRGECSESEFRYIPVEPGQRKVEAECLIPLSTRKAKLVGTQVVDDGARGPRHPDTYRGRRAVEYPSIQEQLDAIWKGGEAMEAMRQQVLAVKAKHPKR